MVGGVAARCPLVVLACAIAACSGNVIDGGPDGGGSVGAQSTGGASPDNGSSGGASGGRNTGGTRSGSGGTPAGGGTANGAGSSGGARPTGGAHSGGGAASDAGSSAGGASSGGMACGEPSEPNGFRTARVDLPALCDVGVPFTCGFSAQQLLEGYECSPDAGTDPGRPEYVIVKSFAVGCGNETVSWNAGHGGPSQTFSRSTGELIGGTLSSDVTFGPCDAFRYVAGTTEDGCAENITVKCVPSSVLAGGPPVRDTCTTDVVQRLANIEKRPDCDCSSDPGVDPCFGAGSCQCWCSRFVPLARACAGLAW